MKNLKFDKKYIYWGLTALCVIAIALLGNHLLLKWSIAQEYISLVLKALRPIIIGLIMAYVLNPLMKIYEKYIFSKLFGVIFKKNEKLQKRFTRACGILFTLATALALVAWLLFLMIPELYVNIKNIVVNMPTYIESTVENLTALSKQYPEIAKPVLDYFTQVANELETWVKDELLYSVDTVITNLYSGIYTTFKVILDVIIGFIICTYILAAKEKYAAGARKIAYATFNNKNAENFLRLVSYTDDRFGGFLVGKIVDSIIIGLLSFIVFSIFDIPYTTLVSVIVGVTNVIPFFGPFIGAIPCALLILLVDPVKALVFTILILAIQQLDGNVIGPKILGDRTGIDSFGVIFSILLAGGLFGVPGMILGVPLFATIFGIVKSVCDKKLNEKNMPTKLSCYNQLEVDYDSDEDED